VGGLGRRPPAIGELHPRRGGRARRPARGAAANWTTTAKGSLLLSAIAFANAMVDVDRFCMNSMLNLMPSCLTRNGVKGNLQKIVA
jgi:hypothetical protein